jgi:hypothetical protein
MSRRFWPTIIDFGSRVLCNVTLGGWHAKIKRPAKKAVRARIFMVPLVQQEKCQRGVLKLIEFTADLS